MAKTKKYRFNSGTLSYELESASPMRHVWRTIAVFGGSLAILFLFVWLMTSVFHTDLPKTFILRMKNDRWVSRVEMMNRRMDSYDDALSSLQSRDDHVYRALFGLGEIPQSVREGGISGVNRYVELDEKNPALARAVRRLDMLLKKAVIQSRSYDEVEALTVRAGEVATHIPAICPMNPEEGSFRYVSVFGYRNDPVYKGTREKHAGIDLACPSGNPVYATGDGVVEFADYNKGYGNSVVIDHGFGYKTRYAHLKEIVVTKGQKVTRGTHIGYSGNTGKSTGPHLHYEVIFRGEPVDPVAFFDMEMPVEDYFSVVTEVAHEGKKLKNRKTRR